MSPLNSIKARFDSFRQTRKSRYWEYSKYFTDGIVWDNTFLFESFSGSNFQGNPYYIYKELINRDDFEKYKIYISAKQPKLIENSLKNRGLLRTNVKVIAIHSAEYRDVLAHAKYLINNVSFTIDFIKKDEQVYLNTWHGTPLKTLGRTVLGDPFAVCNGQRNFLLADYLLAPNELTKRVYEFDYMVHDIIPGELVLGGYPRNSIFFDKEAGTAVRDKYGLHDIKTVFYMPTWRGTTCDIYDVDQVSDIEKLAEELGDSYKVFVKFHPAMGKTSGDFKYCHNMPDDIEVYEFLNAMDILITDYSSVFFDFASTGKKIVLYQYDREDYFKSRGVYREVEESLGFPIAYNYQQLYKFVTAEDTDDYSDFVKKYCPYDSIEGAKKALALLLNNDIEKTDNHPTDLYVIDYSISEEELNRLKSRVKSDSFRFVFVLNRKSKGYNRIQSWKQIDYFSVNTYDRLSGSERIGYFLNSLFPTKKAKEKISYYCSRERKRLWGNVNIGKVYTNSSPRKLPTALKDKAERIEY